MWIWGAVAVGILLGAGGLYLWLEARREREAKRRARPLYGWCLGGGPFDPEAIHILTTQPPPSNRSGSERG